MIRYVNEAIKGVAVQLWLLCCILLPITNVISYFSFSPIVGLLLPLFFALPTHRKRLSRGSPTYSIFGSANFIFGIENFTWKREANVLIAFREISLRAYVLHVWSSFTFLASILLRCIANWTNCAINKKHGLVANWNIQTFVNKDRIHYNDSIMTWNLNLQQRKFWFDLSKILSQNKNYKYANINILHSSIYERHTFLLF